MSAAEAASLAAIRRSAIILRAVTMAAAFALPLTTIAIMVLSPAEVMEAAHMPPGAAPHSALNQLIVVGVASVPVLLVGFGLLRLAGAFAAIAGGEYFTRRVFGSLRTFASALFLSGFASLLVSPIVSLFVTWADEERSLSISIGTPQLGLIFFAAILWIFAQLLARAAEIEAENRAIV